MNLTFHAPPNGKCIPAIPSKAVAHRQLICASLVRASDPSAGETRIVCGASSDDIDATAGCMQALGAEIIRKDGVFTVRPSAEFLENAVIDCRESGSTLRFLLPVAAAIGKGASFVRRGGLVKRPLSPLYEELIRCGVSLPEDQKTAPLPVGGKLRASDFEIAANVSSQYISGLLMAMPLIDGECSLTLTGRIESEDYIKITLSVLKTFGVEYDVSDDGRRYTLSRDHRKYRSPGTVYVEGDWSNSAMWLAAGIMNKGADSLCVTGLDIASPQGDRRIVEILRDFGGNIRCLDDGTLAAYPSELHGIEVDVAQCPDLAPVIGAVAAHADGETVITGIERLRIKESDRAAAICEMLQLCGVYADNQPDRIVIRGGSIRGSVVSAMREQMRDHRMVMCAFLLSIGADGDLTVTESQSITKSYPGFTDDLALIGGKFTLSE